MTMKMMISTSRMSISGTTLGVAIAPPFSPPTSIPIASLLVACARAIQQAVKPRRVGSGAAVENQQTNGTNRNHGPQSAEGGGGVVLSFWFFSVSNFNDTAPAE